MLDFDGAVRRSGSLAALDGRTFAARAALMAPPAPQDGGTDRRERGSR